jgi:methionyl-tRNA formyltransferase
MDNAGKDIPIIFFGTPAFAAVQLDRLLCEGYKIEAVVTAPDKPAGRGLRLRHSEVKQVALRHNVPIFQPYSLKDLSFINEIRLLNAQLFIVIAFRMLPKELWAMPPFGTFNLHASLLPDYRGAAPINWAIINGETETGLTTFFLNEYIDEGNIIMQHRMTIGPDETAGELHDRMIDEAWPLLKQTLDKIAKGCVTTVAQDHSKAIHKAPKLKREHLRINWFGTANEIRNTIRGLSPKPGAYTEIIHQSGKRDELRIFRASLLPKMHTIEPYRLFVVDKQLLVNHPECMLKLEEVQLKGKNILISSEFVKGFRDDGGWKVALTV